MLKSQHTPFTIVATAATGRAIMLFTMVAALLVLFAFTPALAAEKSVSQPPEVSGAATPAAPREEAAHAFKSMDSVQNLYQSYLKNIFHHNPMYFLMGTDPKKSKFQISFKYKITNNDLIPAADTDIDNGVFIGYTQTSFWDLDSASMPFKDTSYKPEIFYTTSNLTTPTPGSLWTFVSTGFQHESNGRDAEESRSTNVLYLKPYFIYYDASSLLGIQVAPKFWLYVDSGSHTELEDYRGYFDLELKMGKADSYVVETHFRTAEKGSSFEVDFTYPVSKHLMEDIDIFFHVQYVNSLAESMIDFEKRTEALRFGISIVR